MSGSQRRPWGKVRQKLAKRLLEEHGLVVTLLAAAQGRERSDWRADIYRWEAFAYPVGGSENVQSWISSYDTMTDCARYGMTLHPDGTMNFDAYAKLPLDKT